jgi:anti-sigma-K factor RskA
MTDEHDRLRDDVAAYAVAILDAVEQTRVEGHLRRCEACARRLHEYRAIFGLLPHALPSQTPTAGALTTLLAEARRRRASADATRARQHAAGAWWRRPAHAGPLGWATAAAFLALIGWNLALHWQIVGRPAPVPVEQLARLPDGRIVALIGTGTPQASARIFVDREGRRGELAIAGLPALPPGRVYQLWFARPGGPPISGGVFRADTRGEALVVVVVPVALEPARAIAVTEEPAPGSPAPTGPHLLDRQL